MDPNHRFRLVLSHPFERLIGDGVVKDYAEVARRTGLTRARVTQITDLTLLSPAIQEEILGLTLAAQADLLHERNLRVVVAELDWGKQRARWSR